MSKSTLEVGAALPSHLTKAQVALLLGVSHSAVWQRVHRGVLPVVPLLGLEMIPTMAVLAVAGISPPSALSPTDLMGVVSAASSALAAGVGDKPLFSANDLVGVYLGVSRLPWPPPPSLTEEPDV